MKTTKMFAAALVVGLLAACGTGTTAVPTQTVTVSATVSAEPTTPAPTTSEPTQAETALLYSDFYGRLGTELGEFADAAEVPDYADAVHHVRNIKTLANEGLELPDFIPGFDDEWDSAMEDLSMFAALGIPAIEDMDSAKLTLAGTYLQDASEHLDTANALLTSIIGSLNG